MAEAQAVTTEATWLRGLVAARAGDTRGGSDVAPCLWNLGGCPGGGVMFTWYDVELKTCGGIA